LKPPIYLAMVSSVSSRQPAGCRLGGFTAAIAAACGRDIIGLRSDYISG